LWLEFISDELIYRHRRRMAKIFDGKKLAAEKEKVLAKKVAEFKKTMGVTPKLVAIMVGESPASCLYLQKKSEVAKRVGMEIEIFKLNELGELISLIREKNKDEKTCGIMIQLPIKVQSSKFKVQNENLKFKILSAINPLEDVDCLTPENFGLLAMGKPRFLPATVKGIMAIIENWPLKIENLNVCVVGGSNIVGKPLALHLSNLGATVTICRSKTENLGKYTRQADLLVSATGVPKLIKKDMVKEGAAVIDVGSPVGDVDFENVSKIASFITPVPGGVGPLTVVCLLENLFQAAGLRYSE